MIAAAAALGPTPFWYATRGSGFAALVLLTATVVLGLLTSARYVSPAWPRFLSQALHRNLSLLVVVFLVIHIATSIIDPFAGLTVRDAVVPAGADYRPLWLGLGVVSMELFVAVVVSSLLRTHLSFRAWQVVHLLAYISWPVAVLHGIGTGTDTKAVWAILLTGACVAAVAITLVWRLSVGWPKHALLRLGGMAVSFAAVIALAAWTAAGPLQSGWARAAGTPANLLAGGTSGSSSAAANPATALASGLNDSVIGQLSRSGNGDVIAVMVDQRDTTLRITIVARQDGSGTLTAVKSGQTICNVSANIGNIVSAQCGNVAISLNVVVQGDNTLSGTLSTQATHS